VFGEVVEGHDVLDKINSVNTGHHGMHADVPNDAIIIKKATVKAVTKKKSGNKKVAAKKTATKKVPAKKAVAAMSNMCDIK
jgi:cyclophilin family peptidyl-prolyl cis-trans isomerase